MHGEGKQMSLLSEHATISEATVERKRLTSSVKLSGKIRFFELSWIIMKTWPNKVQILNENEDKQSQNTRVEVNIFAWQKSKVRSRVWIVQNNFHNAKT